MARALSTPAALLLGLLGTGAMVSVAVYLALAGGRATAIATTTTTTTATGTATGTGTGTATAGPSPSPSPSPTPIDRSAVVAEVQRALEPQRAALVKKCWAPSVARSPAGADHVDYLLDYTFAADGSQLARGMIDAPVKPGGPSPRGDVSGCVSLALAPVSIAPRGTTVAVKVPLRLP